MHCVKPRVALPYKVYLYDFYFFTALRSRRRGSIRRPILVIEDLLDSGKIRLLALLPQNEKHRAIMEGMGHFVFKS